MNLLKLSKISLNILHEPTLAAPNIFFCTRPCSKKISLCHNSRLVSSTVRHQIFFSALDCVQKKFGILFDSYYLHEPTSTAVRKTLTFKRFYLPVLIYEPTYKFKDEPTWF